MKDEVCERLRERERKCERGRVMCRRKREEEECFMC